MRIWDIPPKKLCRGHLLGEHRELHGLWNIYVKHDGTGGYSSHPETIRWKGKLSALYSRHELLVLEFSKRDYKHKSDLEKKYAHGKKNQDLLINSLPEQIKMLLDKNCDCILK